MLPSSKLSEAITYSLARWPSLLRYLDDDRLAIDTNHLERKLRPLAQGRASWLFLGRESAGATAAVLYTVIQSARLNEVDALPYLTNVLRCLPAFAACRLAEAVGPFQFPGRHEPPDDSRDECA